MEPASVFSVRNPEHLLMFRGGMPLYVSAASDDGKNTFETITNLVGKGIKKLDKIRKIFIVTMDGIKALGAPVEKFTKLTPKLAKTLPFINYAFETFDFADKLSNCIEENPQNRGRCVVSSAGYMVGKICTEALGSAVTLSALSPPAYLSSPIGQVALISTGITISMKADEVGESLYNYILSSSGRRNEGASSSSAHFPKENNIDVAAETYNKHMKSNSETLRGLLFSPSEKGKKPAAAPKSQIVVPKNNTSFSEVLQNITDVSSFGAGVAAVLGDKDTARQIARVSNTLVTSSRLVTSAVAGTISPLGAIGGMLNLIAGLFDDGSSDALEGIIDGINTISRQVEELFEFVSANFGEVHEHLQFQDRVAIMHFCKTTRDIENLRHNFAAISHEIRTASVGTVTMLQEIGGQIENLSASYSNHEIAKIADEVETKIHTAMRKCEASPQNFVESAQTLQILIGQLCHAKYTKFKVNMPHAGFYISPEFLYSINYIFVDEGGRIMVKHPHLYCAASLALIYITLCQYPDNNCGDTMKTIARTDMQRLKQVRTFGRQIVGYIRDLRENLPAVVENYSKEYRQLTDVILKHLREEYDKSRKDIQKQHEERTRTSLSNAYYNVREITAFKSQKIKANVPVAEWFCGNLISRGIYVDRWENIVGKGIKKTIGGWFTYNEGPLDRNTTWIQNSFGQYRNDKITRKWYDGHSNHVLNNCYKQYYNFMGKQIESKIAAYVAIVDKKHREKKLIFPAFIMPEDPNNPILPTGDKVEQLVKREFGSLFTTAQTPISLTYKVNGAQKKIIISIYFGSLKIMEVFANDFDVLFYTGGEKVWYTWNGGIYPQTKETVLYSKYYDNWNCPKSQEAQLWNINLPKMPNKAVVPQFNLQVRKTPEFNRVIEELRAEIHGIDIYICGKAIDHVIAKHRGVFDKLAELNKSFNVYMNTVASTSNSAASTGSTVASNIERMPTDTHLMCIRMLQARKGKDFMRQICSRFQDKVYDKFAISGSSRGSVETVVRLLDAVIDFYGENVVEFNNWYIDESEKIAEMRGNVKLVVSSLKYMDPGNIETFIRKEVEPQLRTLSEASRRRVVEEYKSAARESLPSGSGSVQTIVCRLFN